MIVETWVQSREFVHKFLRPLYSFIFIRSEVQIVYSQNAYNSLTELELSAYFNAITDIELFKRETDIKNILRFYSLRFTRYFKYVLPKLVFNYLEPHSSFSRICLFISSYAWWRHARRPHRYELYFGRVKSANKRVMQLTHKSPCLINF